MKQGRLSTVVSLAVLVLSIVPGVAAAGWRVLPTTGFVTDQLQVEIVNRIGGTWLRSTQNGDQFRVYQGVPVFEGDVIDAIAVCYRADPGTSITAIGLVEFAVPGATTGTSGHLDPTDLNSATDTCHVSPVADYVPGGAVNLWLQLSYIFSGEGTIYVGAVAVHVK
jgi:hypothetical protein